MANKIPIIKAMTLLSFCLALPLLNIKVMLLKRKTAYN